MPIGDVWLDASCDADGLGARSFRASRPEMVHAWRLGDAGDPFDELERHASRGSWTFVLLGYDLGQTIERIPRHALREYSLPDLWLARYPAIDASADGSETELRREGNFSCDPLASEMSLADYTHKTERVLEYIRAGDIYQVNLAHRLRAGLRGDPLSFYHRLRTQSPAPLGAFVDAGDFQVLSNSPELFLRFNAATREIETRPIKGTRPRGITAEEDAQLQRECATDAKERAEHVMIVDLERNDLGRICEIGTVRVEGFHRVVSLPTVHHAVSTVRGRVRPDIGLAATLRATFPGGSITGAPKVRAMQIIEELEPVGRGFYTGAIGFIEPDGSFTFSIAIRTAVVQDQTLHLHVGGGIVADSTAAAEWRETWHKARAFVAAASTET